MCIRKDAYPGQIDDVLTAADRRKNCLVRTDVGGSP